jgi:hypothetical protein
MGIRSIFYHPHIFFLCIDTISTCEDMKVPMKTRQSVPMKSILSFENGPVKNCLGIQYPMKDHLKAPRAVFLFLSLLNHVI